MNKNSVRKFLGRTAFALTASALTITGARAQTAPATTTPAANTPAGDQTVKMESFTVTGSYLPMSAVAPVIPVSTVDASGIAASGETGNLLDVLTKISPVFKGGLNLGPTNGNVNSGATNGGSQVAIGDLPTLVLVNGHRVMYSPVAGVGGFQFVDINQFAPGSVDRIEIETLGASAIYGSDAVGGVVNIILKSNYNGFEMDGSYRFAPDLQSGHWTDRTIDISGGVSDGKNSISIAANWDKSDPLYQYQVSTSKYTVGTTNYPGVINIGSSYYILNPSLNAPPASATGVPIATLVANGTYSGPYNSTYIINNFNLANKPTSYEGFERKAFNADFDHNFNDNLKFSSTVLYSKTDTFTQLNAQPVSEKITVGSPFDPLNVLVTAHDRFTAYPRQYLADTPSIQGIAGLDGKIGDHWKWNISGNYGESEQHFRNPNLIEASALAAAEASSSINLFAYTLPAATLANLGIFGTAYGEYDSSLTDYQFNTSTDDLFTLPGGNIGLAIGGEYRREGFSSNADINSLPNSFNWASGTVITPLTVSRNIWAEYAEATIPIVSPTMAVPGVYSLTSDDAIRHEEYAVTSKKPTVPQVTLRWQPFDEQFTVRGSYTQSFIAPSLFELYGPNGTGFTQDLTNFKPFTGASIPNDGQANVQTFTNVGLAPTTAESFSIGFVYSPKQIKGLSITVDYDRIRESAIVGDPNVQPILQDVETKGAASAFASLVALNDFPGQADATKITAPGQIAGNTGNVYINSYEGNVAGEKSELLDINVNYTWDTSIGRFVLDNKTRYNLHFWSYNPDGSVDQLAGTGSGPFNTVGGSLFRWSAYTSAQWHMHNWVFTLANTFDPALVDADDGEHINYYTAWDGSVTYTFHGDEAGPLGSLKGISLTIGMNDIFNRQPSHDFDTFVQDNADISSYSPLGRQIYATVKYKF